MRKHKDALGNQYLGAVNRGKYNKATLEKSRPDPQKDYIIRPDGWRRRPKDAKVINAK